MPRPLLITDCDEVLLHMVVPFREWLDEAHDIHFALDSVGFTEALRHKHDGTLVEQTKIWPLLDGFFESEMHRQMPIDGAIAAIHAISRFADVAVLTNLLDHRRDARTAQLQRLGIDAPVTTNQGGKGPAIKKMIDAYQPSAVVFVDDLANHHDSVAETCPDVWRLHMVGEPELAPHIAAAGAAHARIDTWAEAQQWVTVKLNG